MSTPFPRNPADPLALVAFSEQLLDEVSRAAQKSARKRSIIRLHEHSDPLQRMFNALQPGTYTRPHRHSDPDKVELFVAMRGGLLVVRYADDGAPIEGVVLREGGPVRGVEIPAGAWHSVVSLEAGTVVLEIIQGPYDAATHKRFAPWSPPEEDLQAGPAYVAGLRAHFAHLLPEVAARDVIAAEEEEAY